MKTVEELEAEVTKLKVDCARAELRARDLANALREHLHVATPGVGVARMRLQGTDFDAKFGKRIVRSFSDVGGVLQVFAASPDSDERLREVMLKVAMAALAAGDRELPDGGGFESYKNIAPRVVDELLGAKS